MNQCQLVMSDVECTWERLTSVLCDLTASLERFPSSPSYKIAAFFARQIKGFGQYIIQNNSGTPLLQTSFASGRSRPYPFNCAGCRDDEKRMHSITKTACLLHANVYQIQ